MVCAGVKRTQSISKEGLDLIKRFEGLHLKAHLCPAKVPTIGYGHTNTVTPEDVGTGRTITEEEAEQLLRDDVAWAEAAVRKYVKTPLRQNHFDALVSLTFNIGSRAFQQSTLLKKIHAGDDYKAAQEFLRWVYAGGKILKGLIRRRAAEKLMFEREPLPPADYRT